jgi:predicted Zn-dependent protease
VPSTLGQPRYLVRAAVLLVAAVAAAWLAVGLRDSRLQTQAAEQLSSAPGRALSLLDDASRLNVSTTIDLLRAGAYWEAGDPTAAVATLRATLRTHPDNPSAWGLLARYLQDTDPAAAAAARTRAQELNGNPQPQA